MSGRGIDQIMRHPGSPRLERLILYGCGDFIDVPRQVREALRFVVADSAEDVLLAALGVEARGAHVAVAEAPVAAPLH